jgi:hypothetical protein
MSNDGEIVTWKGQGIGRFRENGKISWRASIFFGTQTTGKLACISNTDGVVEFEMDEVGNSSDKTWEWK